MKNRERIAKAAAEICKQNLYIPILRMALEEAKKYEKIKDEKIELKYEDLKKYDKNRW